MFHLPPSPLSVSLIRCALPRSDCNDRHTRFVGYGNTVIGSIVANRGFVQAFATVLEPATGNMVLDARHISLWNSISFASQIVAQMISPFTADRFGRKFNMWLLTVFLTLVSPLRAICAKSSQTFTKCRPVSSQSSSKSLPRNTSS